MNEADKERRFAELVDFIRNTIGEYEIPITRETLIEYDLGVSGDEADDLIVAFAGKFHVDISRFDFSQYFCNEPTILDFIGVSTRKVKPFKVGYLEKARIAGRLDDTVIDS